MTPRTGSTRQEKEHRRDRRPRHKQVFGSNHPVWGYRNKCPAYRYLPDFEDWSLADLSASGSLSAYLLGFPRPLTTIPGSVWRVRVRASLLLERMGCFGSPSRLVVADPYGWWAALVSAANTTAPGGVLAKTLRSWIDSVGAAGVLRAVQVRAYFEALSPEQQAVGRLFLQRSTRDGLVLSREGELLPVSIVDPLAVGSSRPLDGESGGHGLLAVYLYHLLAHAERCVLRALDHGVEIVTENPAAQADVVWAEGTREGCLGAGVGFCYRKGLWVAPDRSSSCGSGHSYSPWRVGDSRDSCERRGHVPGTEACGHKHGRYGCAADECRYGR